MNMSMSISLTLTLTLSLTLSKSMRMSMSMSMGMTLTLSRSMSMTQEFEYEYEYEYEVGGWVGSGGLHKNSAEIPQESHEYSCGISKKFRRDAMEMKSEKIMENHEHLSKNHQKCSRP